MNESHIPRSEESEVSVLGGVLCEGSAVTEVRGWLEPGDFFREGNRLVYQTMIDLYDADSAVDVVTVSDALGTNLQRAGGMEYLANLLDAVPTAANIRYHGQIVKNKANLRRLITTCRQIIEEASHEDVNPEEIVRVAEERILDSSTNRRSSEYVLAKDAVVEAVNAIEEAQNSPDGIVGMRTGFSWLDRITGGLRPGDLTVLAARPAMGKSAFGWQMARNAALRGHGAAIASYEMSRARLFHRGLAAESRIDSHDLRTGRMKEGQYQDLNRAASKLSGLPIYTQYPPPRTVEKLRADLRRLIRRHPVELFVVDYLQQMDGKGQNRNNEVEHISRNLKRLAADLNIHVLALAQLSRAVEHRSPPRPMLSDLRDSGAIEQDADNVFGLWRPEMYFDDSTPDDQRYRWLNKGELIVLKQRDGETGSVYLHWDGPTTTFSDIEPERRSAA